jgi:uncharacterized protein YjbI with pentapeptide repeats
MTSADLRGAKLSGANLAGATLDIARYDAQTSWPAGLRIPRCARRSCTISS